MSSLSNKTVLVVAAHADDEVLGCGGTIARHVNEGDTVYAVFMADGVSSRIGESANDLQVRNLAAEKAQDVLGIKQIFNLGFPDNQMDTVSFLEIVQKLETVVAEIKPDVIYTHHIGDLNIDHQLTHKAVLTAARPTPACSVKEIYAFEVLSSTEWSFDNKTAFLPNVFIDITQFMGKKTEALKAYELEMRTKPHARSFESVAALATLRGGSVGVESAEAFMCVRLLN